MINKNLAGIYIDVCSNGAENANLTIKATAITEFVSYPFLYREITHQDLEVEQIGENWRITITCEETVNDSKASPIFVVLLL